MNKKFLSAILFGALMVTSTGTFVSCKDYDDDIENLQGQIDNLATKSDVEAKLAQLQAALNAAQAESSANAADIAALEKEVASMMAKVEAAVESEIAEYKTEIEALVKKVETLVGEVADFVTSVELVDSYTAVNGNWVNADKRGHVVVSTTIEKDNVFSKDIANAITFVKGTEIQTPNSFLVRVSPTNAVLTTEMISLVNSKGESLENVMEVVKVEKADILLNREQATEKEEAVEGRAAATHGLWNITVQAKNYGDGKAFAAATTVKINDNVYNDVLFAAQVNNSLSSAEARYVTSTYDLSFGWTKFIPSASLSFTVDGVDVATINNRFDKTSLSLKQTENLGTIATEYEWAASIDKYPTPAVAIDKDKKNVIAVNDGEADDRSAEKVALAVQGKALKIALFEEVDGKKVAPKNVRAIYVTLDKANAVESAPSELNAWNSYSYTGLNTVVEGTSTEITINGKETINDYIGFRVYAVNYDGTLVDPDGKAFYVLVGAPAEDWQVVATTIVPDAKLSTKPEQEKSAAVAVTTTKLTAPYSWSWKVDKDNKPFSIALADKDGKVLKANPTIDAIFHNDQTWEGTNIGADFKFENIKTIYTIPAKGTAWTDYEDDKTYTGTFTVKNADGFALATLRVSMTKVLPNKPEGYSIKTSQLNAEGIYNCYLLPENWVAPTAANGKMPMNDVFNWGDGEPAQYEIKFAEALVDGDKIVANTAKGDGDLVVAKKFIDNVTEHATTVSYNFGQISSKKVDGEFVDYVVSMDQFPTVFNCIYNDTYTWNWATIEEMATEHGGDWAKKANGAYVNKVPSTSFKYGIDYWFTTPANVKFGFDQAIQGVSARDSKYNAMLWKTYSESGSDLSLEFVEGHVITVAGNVVDEYFTVAKDDAGNLYFKATATSENTNPTADVPSVVELTYNDMYKHKIVIKLEVTIVKR